ncbi:MAG: hypothetical protein M3537_06455, partial [Chloroflexota bacterium]|nr:hypothetical protein [Chloroflexota bacterium]
MTHGVAITHVPGTRDRMLEGLVAALGQATIVVNDHARRGCWPTVREAWRTLIDAGFDHGLVLADDMIPCPDLTAALPVMAAARPGHPVGLYTGRHRLVEMARSAGSAWALTRDGWWGGSFMMPTSLAADWLDWCDLNVTPAYPHDDGRAGLWSVMTGKWLWRSHSSSWVTWYGPQRLWPGGPPPCARAVGCSWSPTAAGFPPSSTSPWSAVP